VYDTLSRAVAQIPGWSPVEELFGLYSAAVFDPTVPGDLVEIGAWCGRSTVALGLAARTLGRVLHSVDIFPEKDDWYQNKDGTWSIRLKIGDETVDACNITTVWDDAFRQTVLPIYSDGNSPRRRHAEAISKFGLKDSVKVHRATAKMFLRDMAPDSAFKLVFLDADHGEAAVGAEIDSFLPRLSAGGALCFDDAFTSYEGVDDAIVKRLLERQPPVVDAAMRVTRKMFLARKRRP
jgi:predicted O-methyltransferase YrrM